MTRLFLPACLPCSLWVPFLGRGECKPNPDGADPCSGKMAFQGKPHPERVFTLANRKGTPLFRLVPFPRGLRPAKTKNEH